MNDTAQKLIYVGLPFIVILGFFIFTSNDTSNDRQDPNEDFTFESRLAVEEDFPTETKESIAELETETLAEGEGEEVVAGDSVTVHYRGWLAEDGTIFDQSFVRGDTGFTFTAGPTGTVIEGWQEGVIGMKPGEVRRLYIPSDLGYGEQGSGSIITPNADLIFDVELMRIN